MTQFGEHQKPDEDEREARRILNRVERESELVGSSSMARAADKVRDHFLGEDDRQADQIDILGKRIARGLAVVMFVVLAVSLYSNYIAPS